jgi:hypothetical protein
MDKRDMSDDHLTRQTQAYLTQRTAMSPPRDLEERILRFALARRRTRRLGTALGLVAVAVVSISAAAGLLYLHVGAGGWRVAEDTGDASLYAVSCGSATECWAVGTAIEHYAADSGWSVDRARLPAGGVLNGIACPTTSTCWAVGVVQPRGASRPLIEGYVGGIWTTAAAPTSSGGSVSAALNSVTCINVADCWAVGRTDNQGASTTDPVIAHYSGGAWSIVEASQVGESGGELSAVACVNAEDCWAVGTGANRSSPLIEHYSGGTWTIAISPLVGRPGGTLNAVTCAGAYDCWAVGSSGVGDTTQPVIERYSTAGWALASNPHVSVAGGGELMGVACAGQADCWAVGDLPGVAVTLPQGSAGAAGSSAPSTQPLIEHYSGGAWAIEAGTTSTNGALIGISCSSITACWAVGGALIETSSS